METESFEPGPEFSLMDIVLVGFNKRVLALHRETGEVLWDWKSPDGTGFPALLLDGDRLIVSVQGYMHCLDPMTGEVLWSNPLSGYGIGTAALASLRGSSGSTAAAAVIAEQQAAAAAGT